MNAWLVADCVIIGMNLGAWMVVLADFILKRRQKKSEAMSPADVVDIFERVHRLEMTSAEAGKSLERGKR